MPNVHSRDSHRALQCGYPSNYKLYDRIGRCYYKLKRMDQAVAAFKMASEAVDADLKLTDEAKAKLKKDIDKIMRPLAAKLSTSSPKLDEGSRVFFLTGLPKHL